MNYSIYKLSFNTPVHFGISETALNLESAAEHFLADTLFSALAHEALKIGGESELNKFKDKVIENKLKFSDAMPWSYDSNEKQTYFYLPKPMLTGKRSLYREADEDPKNRKALKDITWIRLDEFPKFISAIKEGKKYIPERLKLGEEIQFTRASISRNEHDDTVPYYVGAYDFFDNRGLYFILGYEDEEDKAYFEKLLRNLSYSGIGGKVSSGYGKFSFPKNEDEKQDQLVQMKDLITLLEKEAPSYMLITSSIPRDEELEKAIEDANFSLIRRSGFIQSENYADNLLKKETQFFLTSGSVLKDRFEGDVYNVAPDKDEEKFHPIYRYSKPLFIGVDYE